MSNQLLLSSAAKNVSKHKPHGGSCPQINPSNVDVDGMPLAPPEVLTSPQGAWSVFSCAINQATSFHSPTAAEKDQIIAILDAFYKSKVNGGPSTDTTKTIMSNAKLLGLQVCRLKFTDGNNEPASVLLFYTAPGVKDYSGPFMMLRETKSSNFVIYSPHDDGDGTFAATKLGMINSYAVACFSEGHKRGQVSGGDKQLYRESDWVHAKSVNLNLGDVAIQRFSNLYPHQVAIQFHGIANPKKCMFHARNDAMGTIFKNTLMKNTRLTADNFTGFPVWFTIDQLIKSNYYIKCEIPAVIYQKNPSIVSKIVTAMEEQKWCWDNKAEAQSSMSMNMRSRI